MTTSAGSDIEGFRRLLDEVFDDTIVGWTAEAEASERFPRELIEHLGAGGVFRSKWGPAG
ncbi:MAG: acyl-CoA dehydrogenase, partial [Mycobacterium sp.]|nr:acyl-CoA dehydrogenase [Mycobacterium sp.]